jgi:hypothetical protein
MPDLRQAPKQGTSIDPSMRVTLVAFFVFCAAVIALVLGLGWKGLLHWTGELLLLGGISLAAKGISDVRREWTGAPASGPAPSRSPSLPVSERLPSCGCVGIVR